MFFIIHVIIHILHHIFNKHAFNKPYEHSLLYSFLIVFLLIDYTNVTKITINDFYFIIAISWILSIEPMIVKKEYSMLKILTRIYIVIIINVFFSQFSDFIKEIIYFYNGYFLISIICQSYSLFIVGNKIKKERKKEKKIKIKINKRIRQFFRKLLKIIVPSFVLKQINYLDNDITIFSSKETGKLKYNNT